MIQNTVVEIVSAVIRDWRMYWARACMTALVQVLDDAVVGAVDMDGDLGRRPGLAAAEAGDRDGAQAVVAGPGEGVHDIGDRPEDETAMSTSPGLAWDCSW